MATVARDEQRDDWVDEYLAYLHAEWDAVPSLVADWAGWTEHDRLDFALDWPVREDRLCQLAALAREGRMSESQQGSYDQLRALVARHRPLLDQLFQAAGLPGSALPGPAPRA
jgi:hypothetical protein